MPHPKLSVEDLLSLIEAKSGTKGRDVARRLIDLGTEVGAQPLSHDRSVSLRMPGPVDGKPDWLTLFVVSEAGTIYNFWHERWTFAGVPKAAVDAFENAMSAAIGSEFVSTSPKFRNAAPLYLVEEHWEEVEGAVRVAAGHILEAVNAHSPR